MYLSANCTPNINFRTNTDTIPFTNTDADTDYTEFKSSS